MKRWATRPIFLMGVVNLPPDPNSEHQAGNMDRLARAAGESCCLAERTRIGESDVRGNFTRDLIAKPYAAIEIGQSRSNPPSTICLTVEIHFDLRLQYQALTEIQIVRAFDFSRDASSIANIKRRRKIEKVRSKSLHAECGPRPSWTGIEIDTRTRLPIKVTHLRNRPVVQNLVVSIAGGAVCHSSFGLEPQLIEVCSNPALAVPTETTIRPVRSAFQLVERYKVKYLVILHWLGPIRCRSWCVNRSRLGLCTNRHSSEARQQRSREDKLKSAARDHDTATARNMPASM